MPRKVLERTLRAGPEVTVHALTRLPIDITSMEQINSILYSDVLNEMAIDPNDLIREYIQHALRIIERMGPNYGAPPTPLPLPAESSSSPGPSSAGGGAARLG